MAGFFPNLNALSFNESSRTAPPGSQTIGGLPPGQASLLDFQTSLDSRMSSQQQFLLDRLSSFQEQLDIFGGRENPTYEDFFPGGFLDSIASGGSLSPQQRPDTFQNKGGPQRPGDVFNPKSQMPQANQGIAVQGLHPGLLGGNRQPASVFPPGGNSLSGVMGANRQPAIVNPPPFGG